MKTKLITLALILLYPLSLFAYLQIPDVTILSYGALIQNNKKLLVNTPITSVTKKQIARSYSNNVTQLLQQNSSLIIQDLNGDQTNGTISMRGFGDNAAQNSLILVNGQPLTNPDLGAPNLNLIPVSNIDHIEISQNSQSVLYGDQAIGGVINLITTTPEKLVRRFNLGYGSFVSKTAQAELGDRFDNGLGYDISLHHFDSHHHRAHNRDNQNSALMNLSYQNSRAQSYLNFEQTNQQLQLPGGLTRQQLNQSRTRAKNHNDKTNFNNSTILFGTNIKINNDWHSKLDGSLLNGKGNGTISLANTPYKYRNERKNIFLRPELSGNFNLYKSPIKPIVGASFKQSEYKYKSTLFGSDDHQKQFAAFGTITVPLFRPNLKNGFYLTAGLRGAQSLDVIKSTTINQSERNRAFITSIGLHYHLTKALHFYMRRAGNYRFPKVDENSNTQNNQPLKTQTGASYEFGSSWKCKQVSALFELYQLDLKNEIAYIPLINSPGGFGFNQNLDRTRRRGINLSVNYNPLSYLQINSGYQYVRPKFTRGPYKGNDIPNIPKQTLSLGATVEFLHHFSFFMNTNYLSSRFSNSDVQNKQRMGGYTLLNTGLGYKIKWIMISLKVNNLTNKQYYSQTVMRNPTSSNSAIFYYPAPGINGSINFTASF